jgi:hypothetical protein
VTWAIEEKSYSLTRACVLIGLARKTYPMCPSAQAMRRFATGFASLRMNAGASATGVCISCLAGKG